MFWNHSSVLTISFVWTTLVKNTEHEKHTSSPISSHINDSLVRFPFGTKKTVCWYWVSHFKQHRCLAFFQACFSGVIQKDCFEPWTDERGEVDAGKLMQTRKIKNRVKKVVSRKSMYGDDFKSMKWETTLSAHWRTSKKFTLLCPPKPLWVRAPIFKSPDESYWILYQFTLLCIFLN